MVKYWEIKEGKVDSTVFFQSLPKYFQCATTFYAEGTTIVGDVADCYRAHYQNGEYLPDEQTIFPKSEKFRCEFSSELMNGLAELSEHHAGCELLDHLFIYKDEKPLLSWPDAFGNVMEVSGSISEESVSGFAGELGLAYSEKTLL